MNYEIKYCYDSHRFKSFVLTADSYEDARKKLDMILKLQKIDELDYLYIRMKGE